MTEVPDLATLPPSHLLRLYAQILTELISRGVIRSRNAPAGDYAELLVAEAYGGELADRSVKSYDVTVAGGRKLQVKCRVVVEGDRRSHSYSPFRSFDFDGCVFVVLDAADYHVVDARELTVDDVHRLARDVTWVAGKRVNVRQILAHDAGQSLTEELRGAQARIDAHGTDGRAGQRAQG